MKTSKGGPSLFTANSGHAEKKQNIPNTRPAPARRTPKKKKKIVRGKGKRLLFSHDQGPRFWKAGLVKKNWIEKKIAKKKAN